MTGGTRIFLGGGGEGYASLQSLQLRHGNRRGLIAGAAATGNTVTLRIVAEQMLAEACAAAQDRELAQAQRYGARRHDPAPASHRSGGRRSDSLGEAMMKSAVRAAKSQLGRTLMRSLIRGLFR